MRIKKDDTVMVIAGKDKGKTGKVLKAMPKENKVIVEGINIAKKHVKPQGNQPGSIVEVEAPIHASNVMIIDPKTKKGTRIGHEIDKKGKKIRVTKKSNSTLD